MSHGERHIGARLVPRISVLGLVAALALILAACGGSGSAGAPSSTSPAASGAGTQTSEGGNVTVKVTWQGTATGPVFTVAMDTHSVDLDRYDLRQLAVLRTDQGQEIQPTGWDAPKGGHHREGTLTFPATTADGQPFLGPNTRSVELVIRNVAGVPERILRWTV